MQLRGRKALQPRGDLLDIVAAAAGVQQEVWDQEISGAVFRIQSPSGAVEERPDGPSADA